MNTKTQDVAQSTQAGADFSVGYNFGAENAKILAATRDKWTKQ